MSEFHRTRRHAITDMAAFLGFLAGFLIAAPLTFLELRSRFESGDLEGTLMTFVLRVLGTSIVWGVVGIAVGYVLGWMWEGGYRLYRHYHPPRIEGETDVVPRPVKPAAPVKAPVVSKARDPAADPPIRYDGSVPVEGFLGLARRIWPGTYDASLTARALEKTINIGAWDEDRLVGAVRVLTDGYLFATVPEVLVHPDYRRRGIGRELMRRAVEAAPRGTLFFGARPSSEGFFRRLGAEPGPAGFVMRRTAAMSTSSPTVTG
jgi:GNAT superfamily N-acetyltransferase